MRRSDMFVVLRVLEGNVLLFRERLVVGRVLGSHTGGYGGLYLLRNSTV
jgi:hypothetical protein